MDAGWDFLKGTFLSNDRAWAVTTGAAWQHPVHPSPSSGSLANRQAFVYGYYLDSKFKVLCSHQVLEYYCEGMLGRWFQSYA